MEIELKKALVDYLVGIADDELILAHRDSEWCGHAPIIEEDIAFANISLDEMGHAAIWYKIVAELLEEDPETYPDKLVFSRQASHFRNIQMVELPKGDWAFSILRQYIFDAMEMVRLEAMIEGTFTPISEAAIKIRQEEIYHLRHTSLWIKRLAMGTEESHKRMQDALNSMWLYAWQMFKAEDHDRLLHRSWMTPDLEIMCEKWTSSVLPYLKSCELVISDQPEITILRDQHTQHFPFLITEMQSVARSDPQAVW